MSDFNTRPKRKYESYTQPASIYAFEQLNRTEKNGAPNDRIEITSGWHSAHLQHCIERNGAEGWMRTKDHDAKAMSVTSTASGSGLFHAIAGFDFVYL